MPQWEKLRVGEFYYAPAQGTLTQDADWSYELCRKDSEKHGDFSVLGWVIDADDAQKICDLLNGSYGVTGTNNDSCKEAFDHWWKTQRLPALTFEAVWQEAWNQRNAEIARLREALEKSSVTP